MPQAHQSATHLAAFHPLPTLLSCPELQAFKFCGRSGYLRLGDEYHSLCEVCSSEEVKPPPWRSDWVRLVQNPRAALYLGNHRSFSHRLPTIAMRPRTFKCSPSFYHARPGTSKHGMHGRSWLLNKLMMLVCGSTLRSKWFRISA